MGGTSVRWDRRRPLALLYWATSHCSWCPGLPRPRASPSDTSSHVLHSFLPRALGLLRRLLCLQGRPPPPPHPAGGAARRPRPGRGWGGSQLWQGGGQTRPQQEERFRQDGAHHGHSSRPQLHLRREQDLHQAGQSGRILDPEISRLGSELVRLCASLISRPRNFQLQFRNFAPQKTFNCCCWISYSSGKIAQSIQRRYRSLTQQICGGSDSPVQWKQFSLRRYDCQVGHYMISFFVFYNLIILIDLALR